MFRMMLTIPFRGKNEQRYPSQNAPQITPLSLVAEMLLDL